MSARQRVAAGVLLFVAAGMLTACGAATTTTPAAVAPAASPVPATTGPTTGTGEALGVARSAVSTAESDADPFGGSATGGATTPAAGAATTAGPTTTAGPAPSTGPTTTTAPGASTAVAPTTTSPAPPATTARPISTTTVATRPAGTTGAGPARYVEWTRATATPGLAGLSRTLVAIGRAISADMTRPGTAPLRREGRVLLAGAVALSHRPAPPVAALTRPWSALLASYADMGRAARAAAPYGALVAGLRRVARELRRYDRAATAAGVPGL